MLVFGGNWWMKQIVIYDFVYNACVQISILGFPQRVLATFETNKIIKITYCQLNCVLVPEPNIALKQKNN